MTRITRRKVIARSLIGFGLYEAARLFLDHESIAQTQTDSALDQRRAMVPTADRGKISMKRAYTECRYGQLHFIRAMPIGSQTQKSPLIMLHQNPSSSVEYEPLIREMAADRQVIAFDTPGNGMSDWPPEPAGIVGYAAAFADGLDALGIWKDSPVDVFGFHTGTLLAAELAIAHPKRVGRLAISGIPYRTPEERGERLKDIEARPRITEDGKAIMGQLQKLWTFVVSQRDPRVPLERAAEIFIEKAKPLDRSWWPYAGVWTYDFLERFPLISQPTLVVQPDEPLLEYSKQAAKLIRNVTYVELPGLNRDVFDVGPEQIAEKLKAFLS
jgi:pimeloyl-ACP methyl ester carboxylesterase